VPTTGPPAAQPVNSAVVVFTLVTVPAHITLALLQVLGTNEP
jgi:hypothetical protein